MAGIRVTAASRARNGCWRPFLPLIRSAPPMTGAFPPGAPPPGGAANGTWSSGTNAKPLRFVLPIQCYALHSVPRAEHITRPLLSQGHVINTALPFALLRKQEPIETRQDVRASGHALIRPHLQSSLKSAHAQRQRKWTPAFAAAQDRCSHCLAALLRKQQPIEPRNNVRARGYALIRPHLQSSLKPPIPAATQMGPCFRRGTERSPKLKAKHSPRH